MIRSAVFVLLPCLFLAACAEGTSVYHLRSLKPGVSAVTVDAKQRTAFVSVHGDGFSPSIRLCAEAAPDVFSALSGSGSLGVDVKSQSGNAALSIAETAATIERTQTINMLRESMYRTCERWLSGAISKPTFIVQAARDQQSMVRILAIDQLTRVARPSATVIAGPGTSATAASPAAVALIADLGEERRIAKTAADDAKADHAKARAAAKDAEADCESVTDAPEDDDKKKLWNACNETRSISEKKSAEAAAANSRFDNATTALGSSGSIAGSTAATKPGSPEPGGGASANNSANVPAIAAAVRYIATSPAIDEALMFCIAVLTEGPDMQKAPSAAISSNTPENLNTMACRDILMQYAMRDSRQSAVKLYSFKANPASETLLDYIGEPIEPAKTQHRMNILREASRALSLPALPIDIMDRLQDASVDNSPLLKKAIELEDDAAGKALLQGE